MRGTDGSLGGWAALLSSRAQTRAGRLRAARFLVLAAALAALASSGCKSELPEKDTYAARLYVQRCGGCHKPYDPRSMTAAMWNTQVDLMRPKVRETGAPLTPEERKTILDYLQRNSGKQ